MEQTLIKPIGKGQITIPGIWRKELGITKNTFVRATLTSRGIFLQNSNIDLNNTNYEEIFDEAINEAFTNLGKSGKLDKLSNVLSEKY